MTTAPLIEPLNRLFVYGIFLGNRMRESYGMSSPEYAAVAEYVTVKAGAGDIAVAVHTGLKEAIVTGLLVHVDPEKWPEIDMLEGGYVRKRIRTVLGHEAWMYVGKERN